MQTNYALYVSKDAPLRAAEILDQMQPADLARSTAEELAKSLQPEIEIPEPSFSIEGDPPRHPRLLRPGDVSSPLVVRIDLPGARATEAFWNIQPSNYTREPELTVLEDGVEFIVADLGQIDRTAGIVWGNIKERVRDLRRNRNLLDQHLLNVAQDRHNKATKTLDDLARREQALRDAGIQVEAEPAAEPAPPASPPLLPSIDVTVNLRRLITDAARNADALSIVGELRLKVNSLIDGNHLDGVGALLVADELLPRIEELAAVLSGDVKPEDREAATRRGLTAAAAVQQALKDTRHVIHEAAALGKDLAWWSPFVIEMVPRVGEIASWIPLPI